MICIFQQFFREVVLEFLLLSLYMKHIALSKLLVLCFLDLGLLLSSLSSADDSKPDDEVDDELDEDEDG